MSKIYKHIIKISLLIVGLVMLIHLFMPHDHHYGFVFDIEQNRHSNNNNSDKTPIHCHYFNNIDSELIKANTFINILKEIPVLFTITFSSVFNININYQISNLIKTNDNLPDYCVLVSISPTRGSPLV